MSALLQSLDNTRTDQLARKLALLSWLGRKNLLACTVVAGPASGNPTVIVGGVPQGGVVSYCPQAQETLMVANRLVDDPTQWEAIPKVCEHFIARLPGDKSVLSYCEVVMKSIEFKKKEGAAAVAKELADDDAFVLKGTAAVGLAPRADREPPRDARAAAGLRGQGPLTRARTPQRGTNIPGGMGIRVDCLPGRGSDASVPPNKEAPMKKLVMTLTVLAFMSGSAAFAAARQPRRTRRPPRTPGAREGREVRLPRRRTTRRAPTRRRSNTAPFRAIYGRLRHRWRRPFFLRPPHSRRRGPARTSGVSRGYAGDVSTGRRVVGGSRAWRWSGSPAGATRTPT